MKSRREFWILLGLLAVGAAIPFGVLCTYLIYFQPALAANIQALFSNKSAGEPLMVALAIYLVMVTLTGLWLWGWYERYVFPLHRLTEDVEALVHGSPRARMVEDETFSTGLEPLLNTVMERYQHHEEAVEERLEAALGEVSEQNSRLESLLDALSEGVVVFSMENRILRYNHAATTLFRHQGGLKEGLPISGLIQPEVLAFAAQNLQEQLATSVTHPHVAFQCDTTGTDGGQLARIAPLVVYGGRLEGYILTIEPRTPATVISTGINTGISTGINTGINTGISTGISTGINTGSGTELERSAPPKAVARAPALSGDDRDARPLAALRYVVLDTETTGLDPAEGDRVVSLAAVVVHRGRLLARERFETLVNPGRPIRPAAMRVHGITDREVEGQPSLPSILPDFLRYAESSVLVAHNAAFDLAFLHQAASEAGLSLNFPVLDTMLLSAVLHPNQPSHSLDALLARYGITVEARHSAMGDALMTANLLLRLLPQLETRGIVTLGMALKASRKTPLSKLSYS